MGVTDQAEKAMGPPGEEMDREDHGSGVPEEYEFTALIKTKKGRYTQPKYRDVASFRQEMKEIAGGIEWGVLLRCDSGASVCFFSPGQRQKIGLVDTEPKNAAVRPEGLTVLQAALRDAVIKQFKSNKIKAYIATQARYVNTSRQIGEGIRFLFDASGRPQVNARLEEIIEERERTETQFRWLEALCSELRNNLSKLKELEDSALELLRRDQGGS